jgi:hypothetical protein
MRIKAKQGTWVEARDLRVGDHVMASRIDPSGALAWEPARVHASLHAATPHAEPMIRLVYEHGQILLAGNHQLFLRADGKLARARDLRAGDHLRLATGGTVVLEEVAAGTFESGVAHIAIDPTHAHLIDAGGLVMGDVTAELAFAPHHGR